MLERFGVIEQDTTARDRFLDILNPQRQLREALRRTTARNINQTVNIQFDGTSLSWEENKCYESRGKSVISLVDSAFSQMTEQEKAEMKPFSVPFFLGDRPDVVPGFSRQYPFSFASCDYHDELIPDFNFDRWVEVGLNDYEEVCREMIQRAKDSPIIDKLFWIGNSETHPTRDQFCRLVEGDARIDAINICSWNKTKYSKQLTTGNGKYVSIPDHCNYKYLIDLQGAGYSGRVKYLLHSGRPLFYQERQWNEYWFFSMKPFVHYIPFKEDLSDFYEQFEWALNNEEKCQEIARNALVFANTHLRRQNAVHRYKEILLRLGGKWQINPTSRKTSRVSPDHEASSSIRSK